MKFASPLAWKGAAAAVLSTSGNITLRSAGSILDAVYEQLAPRPTGSGSALDAKLQLTGAQAQQAALDAIHTQETLQTQAYHTYWQTNRGAVRTTVASQLSIATINPTTDQITFSSPHNLQNGDEVVLRFGVNLSAENFNNTARWDLAVSPTFNLSSPPSGPVSVTANDVVRTTANELYRFHGTPGSINLSTADFTDTSKWTKLSGTIDVTSESAQTVNLKPGDVVKTAAGKLYTYKGAATSTSNLQDGSTYYAVVVDGTTIQLVSSRTDAIAGTTKAVDLQLASGTGNVAVAGLNLARYNYSTGALTGTPLSPQLQAIHDNYGSGTYDPDFVYRVSAAERAAQIAARTFQASSLDSAVSQALFSRLYPTASVPPGFVSTPDSTEGVNVQGANITLITSAAGQVGRVTGVVTLNLSQGFASLSVGDRDLLSRATANDVLGTAFSFYKYTGPTNSTFDLRGVNFGNTALWTKITPDFTTGPSSTAVAVQTNQTVLVKGSGGDALYKFIGAPGTLNLNTESYTNAARWQPVAKHSAADGVVNLQQGEVVQNTDSVTLQLFDDVDLEASGNLTVEAGTGAAVQTTGTLRLDHVQSTGNIRLVAGGDIRDVAVSGTAAAITTFGDLSLIAKNFIGGASANTPLRVQLPATSHFGADVAGPLNVQQVSADATINGVFKTISDLLVANLNTSGDSTLEVKEGDLLLGNIASGGNIYLTAARSILKAGGVATNALEVNLTGANLTMSAGTDIGATGAPIDSDLSGFVTAHAGRDIYFVQAQGTFGGVMQVDQVTSDNGTINLTAYGSIVPINAGDGQNGKSTAEVLANNIQLTSQTGGIGSIAAPFQIDSSYFATGKFDALASQAIVVSEIIGDLRLGQVKSTGSDVRLNSPASIVDADNDATADVVGNNLFLTAGAGIGTASNDLQVDSAFSAAGLLSLSSVGNTYLTEAVGSLRAGTIISSAGDLRLTVRESSATGEDLTVEAGQSITSVLGSITLLAGDNILVAAGGLVKAQNLLTIQGDNSDADSGLGTDIQILGSLDTNSTTIFGGRDADHIYLHPQALSGYTRILGDNDGLAGGDDTIILDQLPSITTSHDRPNDSLGVIRDTVDLDGRGGADNYIVNTTGSSDVRINVVDTGAAIDGADILTINGVTGTAANRDDTFLVRANFVAQLEPLVAGGLEFSPTYERINYGDSINVLRINGGDGDDRFYVDDNSALTTIDGGAGDDSFQIGQIFGADRIAPNLQAGDEVKTVETTVGFLSPGISYATTVYGGQGSDNFFVYSNQAPLKLFGEEDNDNFTVRAFVLKGSGAIATAETTVPNGGPGRRSRRVQHQRAGEHRWRHRFGYRGRAWYREERHLRGHQGRRPGCGSECLLHHGRAP